MDFWRGLFKKKCTISESEKAKPNFQEPHALQVDLVVKCVLQFLPQREIKSARFVCQKWNSVAELILRKRSKIVPPWNFTEHNPKSHFANLRFSSFLLSNQIRTWNDSDWQEFCDLWMPNVRFLELHNIFGGLKSRHGRMLLEGLGDGTPLLSLTKNLVELRVSDCSVPLLLPLLDSSVNIKILSLIKCSVIVNNDNRSENRITPWKVTLQNVLFTLRNGNKLPSITINNFVDFVNCSEIEIVCSASDVTKITYDTLRDVTSARKIHLEGIRVLGKKIFHKGINYIKMCSSFLEEQDPDMEVADIIKCDFLLEPKTIKKLTLPIPYGYPLYGVPFDCVDQMDLPNLKYLKLDVMLNAEMGGICAMCKPFLNVTDMEVRGDWIGLNVLTLRLLDIPGSVKRLKLSPAITFKITSDELHIRALDILILDYCSMINPFADAERIMKKIKPKLLVIILKTWVSSSDVFSFISRNIHLERVVVEMPPSSINYQSRDQESSFYEFNNRVGKGLTEEQFDKYFVINSD